VPFAANFVVTAAANDVLKAAIRVMAIFFVIFCISIFNIKSEIAGIYSRISSTGCK